jgi:hypothetical protein
LDLGDYIGTGVALAGVCIAWFWPRQIVVWIMADCICLFAHLKTVLSGRHIWFLFRAWFTFL